ncbi:hypothetical protein SUGI_0038150 [Cryptomeria japonica]|nr:hypothetical protein SUGI_0038150 [Cryptomeria japonica]
MSGLSLFIAVVFSLIISIYWADPNADAKALLAFKYGLNDPIGNLDDWDYDKPLSSRHCRWNGVKLNSDGRVTELDLSNMNLSDVSMNYFSGMFPVGLEQAFRLVGIYAYSNNFRGLLSEDIGRLKWLDHLDLRGSCFDGSIPKTYWELK